MRSQNPHILLVGKNKGVATLENSLAIPKLTEQLPYPTIPYLGMYLRKMRVYVQT